MAALSFLPQESQKDVILTQSRFRRRKDLGCRSAVWGGLDSYDTQRYSTLRTITREPSDHLLNALRSRLVSSSLLARIGASPCANFEHPHPGPLVRRYTEGEKLTYHMKGDNDGWTYEVQANGIVRKDASGHFVEEYGWSDFKSNAPMTLSPASLNFRQTLSLDPATPPSIPNLSQVQPFLIGPITDMLTFYADLWMAIQQSDLERAGDHAYVKVGIPASWADGNYVILGRRLRSTSISRSRNSTPPTRSQRCLAKHVPPQQPKVKLPARVDARRRSRTPRTTGFKSARINAGKYDAGVGKETFDVEIKLSLKDGKIPVSHLGQPGANASSRMLRRRFARTAASLRPPDSPADRVAPCSLKWCPR